MKKILIFSLFIASAFTQVKAQDELTGDTKLACEAVLCLSSGTRPSECAPSLSHYFSIHKKKFSDTIRARFDFLNLCPVSNQTPEMNSLISAISNGAGRCDAASLNTTLRTWWGNWNSGYVYISNQLPDYCSAYNGHAYTDFNSSGTAPIYVGEPLQGGYWVEARDYEQALANYNEQQRRMKENSQASWWKN